MPTVLKEPVRAGEHLVSEVTTQSREVGVITGGVAFNAATVLGKVTASGKYTILAPGASDGSQAAAAILYGPTDVTAADKSATINVRLTEVNGWLLTWPVGITTNQQNTAIAQLAALGIIVRN